MDLEQDEELVVVLACICGFLKEAKISPYHFIPNYDSVKSIELLNQLNDKKFIDICKRLVFNINHEINNRHKE